MRCEVPKGKISWGDVSSRSRAVRGCGFHLAQHNVFFVPLGLPSVKPPHPFVPSQRLLLLVGHPHGPQRGHGIWLGPQDLRPANERAELPHPQKPTQ